MGRNVKGLGSEHYRQDALRRLMVKAGWHIEKMHGGMYQKDFPDLYCMHKMFGTRWVEMKKPVGKLSKGQIKKFILWSKHNTNIWILEGPEDYGMLMKPCNLAAYITEQINK